MTASYAIWLHRTTKFAEPLGGSTPREKKTDFPFDSRFNIVMSSVAVWPFILVNRTIVRFKLTISHFKIKNYTIEAR